MSWPGDHRLVKQRIHAFLPESRLLSSIPRPSIVGAIPQTSGATARIPGICLSSSARAGRQMAENRARDILAEDDQPLDPAQRIADQVAQTVREAEKPQHSQDRDRQANQRQDRPQRPASTGSARQSTHHSSVSRQGTTDRHVVASVGRLGDAISDRQSIKQCSDHTRRSTSEASCEFDAGCGPDSAAWSPLDPCSALIWCSAEAGLRVTRRTVSADDGRPGRRSSLAVSTFASQSCLS